MILRERDIAKASRETSAVAERSHARKRFKEEKKWEWGPEDDWTVGK